MPKQQKTVTKLKTKTAAIATVLVNGLLSFFAVQNSLQQSFQITDDHHVELN